MNKEYLVRMSDAELENYAKAIGIKIPKDIESKADFIEKRRERTAKIEVLGITFEIPIKRIKDKRVTDLISNMNDVNAEKALCLVLGEEQYAKLEEACIEEDGTYDVQAMGYAFTTIFTSPKLKNF